MAGHSQFKNIMHRKGAQDKKRAKVFTKLIREITVAAKAGADAASNPRLRAAILAARAENMPKDKIETAIAKASGAAGSDDYVEMRYEGYGPGGVAIIVEALTDNRNRTASDVRSTFTKHGGNLGETGSVGFMFNRLGVIEYALDAGNEEQMLEAAIEAGADNCETTQDAHRITTAPDNLHEVASSLEAQLGEPRSAKLSWEALTLSTVDTEQAQTLMKLIDTLEDNDDVQEVISNAEFSEETMQQLSA